jgi:dUTP pyrophosphatase
MSISQMVLNYIGTMSSAEKTELKKTLLSLLTQDVEYVALSQNAIEPYRGSEEAAGWDLYADLGEMDYINIAPGEYRKISTGIAIALPQGTFGAIYPRSGMATKRGLVLANGTGIIDSDYRGPVIVALKNTSNTVQKITHGERIAQIIVQPYVSVNFKNTTTIGTTARGSDGFGSTDKKEK